MYNKLKELIVNEVYNFTGEDITNEREPNLEDVLRAMGNLNKGNKTNDFNALEYGIGTDNFWIGNSISGSSMDWHLGKPLSEQKKETIDFLYKLLK